MLMESPQDFDGHVVVRQWLTHSHEHHVGESTLTSVTGCVHDLFHDLAHGELASEPRLTRGAEGAAHRTAGLAGDAHRDAVVVVHEDRFNGRPIAQAKDPLSGGSVIALN